MQAYCVLNVRYDVHGQALVEVDCLLIVLKEQELVTPIQRNVVEERNEV